MEDIKHTYEFSVNYQISYLFCTINMEDEEIIR